MFVDKWEKTLEDTCKYENVSGNGAKLDVEQFQISMELRYTRY